MPKKPILVRDPHTIYQQVKVSLQRRVLGGWKGDQRTFTTRGTTTGQVNSGLSRHSAGYGPATADGATFRTRLIARVLPRRPGLPEPFTGSTGHTGRSSAARPTPDERLTPGMGRDAP